MEQLQESFLRGYRLLSLEDPFLRLHRVKEFLQYCVVFLSRASGGSPHRVIIRRWFLNWAEKRALPCMIRS
jgi:hypothetical protein